MSFYHRQVEKDRSRAAWLVMAIDLIYKAMARGSAGRERLYGTGQPLLLADDEACSSKCFRSTRGGCRRHPPMLKTTRPRTPDSTRR